MEYSGDVTLFNLRGTHSLPVLLYDRNGTSFPTLMLVDTGASKCMIPASYNREYLKLPTLGKTEGVVTADGRVNFDNVSIPRITLAELVLKSGPEYAQLIPNETDLQEANVDAWLGNALVLGMNYLSKFDITLKRTGFIVVER